MVSPRSVLGLALALAMASSALAGCLGTAGATAMQHKSTAQEEAQAWSKEARLVKVVGVEGLFNATPGFASSALAPQAPWWDRAASDPDPGNGFAEVWVYRFVDPGADGLVFTVVVDASGDIVAAEEDEASSQATPLGTWSVDSDEALGIALEVNRGLREASGTAHFGLVSILEHDADREGPVWRIAGGGGDEDGGGGGHVLLDAVTGQVIESQGGFVPR